ncbi:SAM-dependent methyltransferase [Pseudomonas floridensis]|uniref:SAM-dependent methyltransferase n=1 Tax=Pseudomonas floridensis TaxID=1958950 RepID=A0A1X0NCR6_9PSED|nr:class I SAM-dependent methyltransferase [Pseudomonas floridensis]ORC62384.1 SAM-dependent methyltransferase [Pseudomonas floridensis]
MNEVKLHEVMGKLVSDMGAAAMMANLVLGDELGFYKAMADSRPVTAQELADRVQCNPRLVQEWLSAHVASGYIEHRDGQFVLPEEQALVLAIEDSPVYAAGGAMVVASMFHDKDKLVAAMRGDGALPWGEHHPCMFSGTERFFRPGYRTYLVSQWLPALQGVVDKLNAGARVADIGCGHGASTLVMAQAFPASNFTGFDYHAPSIATAKQRAEASGVGARVSFAEGTAKDFPGDGYDLICYFDCLHDMGDPVGAAQHALESLDDDGTVLLVEPYANDSLDENMTSVGRLFYAASTFICTPNSLSQEVGLGLGAQAGEARLRKVFEEAGFSHFRRATETPFNLILEARK